VASLRALTFAALAAATAAIAHGGPAVLADPRWAAAALGGSGLAALVMWRGWVLVARSGRVEGTASLAALIPGMLAAQTAAHLALLGAGAPAHGGAPGSLAFHLALAVVAAILVHRIDTHTQRRAAAALGSVPAQVDEPPRPLTGRPAPAGRTPSAIRGRGPPLTA
jgi:hypothetical protein